MNALATNSAPQPGCDCAACDWARRRADGQTPSYIRRATAMPGLDADLAENYARYEAGELVSRADED